MIYTWVDHGPENKATSVISEDSLVLLPTHTQLPVTLDNKVPSTSTISSAVGSSVLWRGLWRQSVQQESDASFMISIYK